MSAEIKFVNDLPEWFKLAAPNAHIGASDLASILGLSLAALHCRIYRGTFPRPDVINEYRLSRSRQKGFWKASTIKKFVSECANG